LPSPRQIVVEDEPSGASRHDLFAGTAETAVRDDALVGRPCRVAANAVVGLDLVVDHAVVLAAEQYADRAFLDVERQTIAAHFVEAEDRLDTDRYVFDPVAGRPVRAAQDDAAPDGAWLTGSNHVVLGARFRPDGDREMAARLTRKRVLRDHTRL